MLIEAWERLRGYDKWTPAVATVQSATLSRIDVGSKKSPVAVGWESASKIIWQDENQTEHAAIFQAYEESPLYQLCEGDTVNIRYNPANPSEYYLPGLLQSKVTRTWKLALYTVALIVLGIAFLMFLLAR